MEEYFQIVSDTTEYPSNINEAFRLHEHDYYEVYMFLEGDAKYVVEGNEYHLKPHDIILIRKNEMHRVFHNRPCKYSRFFIYFEPEFFEENHCREYERPFLDLSSDNKIEAEVVIASGLLNAIERLDRYTEHYTKMDGPIVKSSLTEILYLINNINQFSKADSQNATLQKVIDYINDHYAEDITLEVLENNFYISKYHLCHLFREETGLTVHQYLTRRRLAAVRELERRGMDMGEIASAIGFKTYSSFYRAYTQVYGTSPNQGRRKFK